MPRYRVPFLAAAGVQTDDGRTFTTVTWRDLPLPLAFQTDAQHAALPTSEQVGQIVALEQNSDGTVSAVIEVDPRDDNNRPIHPEGARAASMIEAGGQGISIDGLVPVDASITEECIAEDDDGWCMAAVVTFSEVVLAGATLTPIPAFSAAIVAPEPLDADGRPITAEDLPVGMVASAAVATVPRLVASAGYALTAAAAVDLAGWELDPAHFAEPEGLSPQSDMVNLDADGRIWGWIAYDSCHASFSDRCVRALDQSTDLSRFLRNHLPVGGEQTPVGFLTMDTGHAPTAGVSVGDVLAHYDDTRSIAAIVTAGVREDGIWFSGSVRPTLDAWARTVLAAANVSGDWRADVGESERTLRAALVVPVPGFGRPAMAASFTDAHDHCEPWPVVVNMPMTSDELRDAFANAHAVPLAASGSASSPAGCGCGGSAGACTCPPVQTSALSPAQRAALARVADERLDADLRDLDAEMALAELPKAL